MWLIGAVMSNLVRLLKDVSFHKKLETKLVILSRRKDILKTVIA